jgi:hypothetical protein
MYRSDVWIGATKPPAMRACAAREGGANAGTGAAA